MTVAGVRVVEILRAAKGHTVVLAPETAGYLVLELAHAYCGCGRLPDDETALLFVEGGGVLLTSPTECPPSEAENALRRLLQRLLAVTSGRAPALEAVVLRPCAAGAQRLIGELESALVPLNRDASKRALSRLARDVLRARSGPSTEEGPSASSASSRSGMPVGVQARPSRTQRRAEARLAVAAARTADDVVQSAISPAPTRAVPVPVVARSANLLVEQFISSPPPDAPRPDSSAACDAADASAACDAADASAACDAADAPACDTADVPAACDAADVPAACDAKTPVVCKAAKTAEAGRTPEACGAVRECDAVDGTDTPNAYDAFDSQGTGRSFGEYGYALAEGVTEPAGTPATATRNPQRLTRDSESHRSHGRGARRRGRGWLGPLLAIVGLAGAAMGLVGYGLPEEVRGRLFGGSVGAQISSAVYGDDCRAGIVVDQLAVGTEVFVRLGVAPLDITRLPEGSQPEFVATADGFEPRRVVVPANAPWRRIDGQLKFELAVQLEAVSKPGDGSFVRPGPLANSEPLRGTVHLVAAPPGAEIWAPGRASSSVRFDALPCGVGTDLLFVRESAGGVVQRRLRVSGNQLTPERGQRAVVAHVSGRP